MRQYASQKFTYSTAYGKAEEGMGKLKKNGRTVRAGPKRRNKSQEGKRVTGISTGVSAGLLREGGNSRRKRTQEKDTKTSRAFPPVSK